MQRWFRYRFFNSGFCSRSTHAVSARVGLLLEGEGAPNVLLGRQFTREEAVGLEGAHGHSHSRNFFDLLLRCPSLPRTCEGHFRSGASPGAKGSCETNELFRLGV